MELTHLLSYITSVIALSAVTGWSLHCARSTIGADRAVMALVSVLSTLVIVLASCIYWRA